MPGGVVVKVLFIGGPHDGARRDIDITNDRQVIEEPEISSSKPMPYDEVDPSVFPAFDRVHHYRLEHFDDKHGEQRYFYLHEDEQHPVKKILEGYVGNFKGEFSASESELQYYKERVRGTRKALEDATKRIIELERLVIKISTAFREKWNYSIDDLLGKDVQPQ
jgi:hypothetical protein